mmetsp:Transcript_24612/g.59347  ORF Transcript_24612/g.59347 Transcript_24612/m.59347 type:complete len:481 (+) Transcript_24612:47-1489(+)
MEHPYHNNDIDDASTLGSKSLGDTDDRSISNDVARNALPRIFDAGTELESICRAEMSGGSDLSVLGFPPTCLPIARLLAGNHCCVDCGDERTERLEYASIGYGTILCGDCATRHVSEMEKESLVRSIGGEHWNLRTTLSVLEGSNTQMLNYVKHKPRWRPPKGTKGNDSEDVLAFKQIYMSKAAATYRKDLAKKVDDLFYGWVTQMRKEDTAREERMMNANTPEQDPFRHILEMNNVSAEEIPGFMNESSAGGNDSNNIVAGAGADVGGDVVVAGSLPAAKASDRRKGRNISAPLMKHDSPNIDLIRQRINTRRSMNPSIRMSEQNSVEGYEHELAEDTMNDGTGRQQPGARANALPTGYLPQSSRPRRRNTQDFVGEVGGPSIQEAYEDASVGDGSYRSYHGFQRKWPASYEQQQEEDERSRISYSSRASWARAPPLGMYRRASSGAMFGGGDGGVGVGGGGGHNPPQQRRPMYRPPQS